MQAERLDAYDHLTWTVGALEDQPDGGEWMACFDAVYNEVENTIDYHVVVDGGSFVDTIKQGSIPAWDKSKVAGLKGVPEYWHYIGAEQDFLMDEEQLERTSASWSAHIDYLLTQGISREDEEAIREQSPEYFDRYIAGDGR